MDEDVESGDSDPILPNNEFRCVRCLKNSGFTLCIFVLFIALVFASIMVSFLIIGKLGIM
jgi:hypothetical protein